MVLSLRTEWDSQRKCQGIRRTDSPREGYQVSVRQIRLLWRWFLISANVKQGISVQDKPHKKIIKKQSTFLKTFALHLSLAITGCCSHSRCPSCSQQSIKETPKAHCSPPFWVPATSSFWPLTFSYLQTRKDQACCTHISWILDMYYICLFGVFFQQGPFPMWEKEIGICIHTAL